MSKDSQDNNENPDRRLDTEANMEIDTNVTRAVQLSEQPAYRQASVPNSQSGSPRRLSSENQKVAGHLRWACEIGLQVALEIIPKLSLTTQVISDIADTSNTGEKSTVICSFIFDR
jgi:hypothetical protein